MSLIARALQDATDTRAIAFGHRVLAQTGDVFANTFPGSACVLVADDNTWAAAGEQVRESLVAAGVRLEEPFVFPGTPTLYADYSNVEQLRDHLAGLDAVACSLASGTLNDIVKLASGELGRPYLNVCTAASMDGYTAFGASITRDGFKITRDCPAPAALVADIDLMASAPGRLTASGYGDLIEKVPGGADWLVADELGIEPVVDGVWRLVQDPLLDALADPDGVASGSPDAVGRLAEGLILSGLAMQAIKSSRPASGAGHNFSHQWEMEGHGLDWEPPLSHGNKVGVGAVATSAVFDLLPTLDVAAVDPGRRAAEWLTPEQNDARVAALQPLPRMREAALAQSRGKYVPREAAAERVQLIKDRWPALLRRVAAQAMPAAEVADRLRRAGAPYHPAQLDVDLPTLQRTYYQSQTIRSRYTILDALVELGLLDQAVDALFAPGGYWASTPVPTTGFLKPAS